MENFSSYSLGGTQCVTYYMQLSTVYPYTTDAIISLSCKYKFSNQWHQERMCTHTHTNTHTHKHMHMYARTHTRINTAFTVMSWTTAIFKKFRMPSITRDRKNSNFKKRGIGMESEKYANKLEIKKVWKQVKYEAQ